MGMARYLAWMSYFQAEPPLILGKTWKPSKKEEFGETKLDERVLLTNRSKIELF